MKLIIAIMTCHNRCEKTLEAIRLFFECDLNYAFGRQLILVDDNSSDGTPEAVVKYFPNVKVLRGDGNLFWNRGMHMAQALALAMTPDYLLWLNDDTELHKNALSILLETAESLFVTKSKPVMVVGSTADRVSGQLTYGGFIARKRWRPFTFERIYSETSPVACDAINGNVVLIPFAVASDVGNLDPVFEHAMGDIDYAMRARAKGFEIYVAPGYVGFCSNNPNTDTYQDTSLPFLTRWKKIRSKKGLPFKSWAQLTRTHGGSLWVIYFAWPI